VLAGTLASAAKRRFPKPFSMVAASRITSAAAWMAFPSITPLCGSTMCSVAKTDCVAAKISGRRGAISLLAGPKEMYSKP
jgi:hypothetical protein